MSSCVLCATELHALAAGIVDIASHFAKAMEQRLTLLHVADRAEFEIPREVPAQVRETLEALKERVRAQAEAAMQHLQTEKARMERSGVPTDIEMRSGRPWNVIVQEMQRLTPSLTVVGRHGAGGEGQASSSALVLGSTAEKVARKAVGPLLVANPHAPSPTAGVWVVGVDFSDASRHAAHWARDLASKVGAELHLVHAIETTDLIEEEVALYGTLGWHPALLDWCAQRAEARLSEVRAELSQVPGEVRGIHVTREGSATDGLMQIANQLNATLLVVGAHGRRALGEWLLGTTAERVLRRHNGSVLCVPSDRSV